MLGNSYSVGLGQQIIGKGFITKQVDVYRDPFTNKKIASLNAGTTVNVIGGSIINWVAVMYSLTPPKIGVIKAQDIVLEKSESPATFQATKDTEVRTGPADQFQTSAILAKGSQIISLQHANGYYKLSTTQWVKDTAVAPQQGQPGQPQPFNWTPLLIAAGITVVIGSSLGLYNRYRRY